MAKNILVFMDGTRNKPSDARQFKDSNVWKSYAQYRDERRETFVKYIRGVGTERIESVDSPAELRAYTATQWRPPAGPVKRGLQFVWSKYRYAVHDLGASAIGWGVADRIEDGLRFICRHYEPGDHLYIFGFSRGAYEARSLAGFLDRVGLRLKSKCTGPDPNRVVAAAYAIYRGGDTPSLVRLEHFLRRRTRKPRPDPGTSTERATTIDIHFVGVWDTVAALGLGEPRRYDVPPEQLARRLQAQATHMARGASKHLFRRLSSNETGRRFPDNVKHGRHALAVHELRTDFEALVWEGGGDEQTLKQVWFAGAHADVGGGYDATHYSDIALKWMLAEADDVGPAAVGSFRPKRPTDLVEVPSLPPHHEMLGWFARTPPTPRRAFGDPGHIGDSCLDGWAVHETALVRLFHSGATDYSLYPFRADSFWEQRYPSGVAAALTELDDHLVRFHVRLANHYSHPPEGFRPRKRSKELLRVHGKLAGSAAALRQAMDRVTGGAHVQSGAWAELAEDLALLLMFEHRAPCEALLRELRDGSPSLNPETRSAMVHKLSKLPSLSHWRADAYAQHFAKAVAALEHADIGFNNKG